MRKQERSERMLRKKKKEGKKQETELRSSPKVENIGSKL